MPRIDVQFPDFWVSNTSIAFESPLSRYTKASIITLPELNLTCLLQIDFNTSLLWRINFKYEGNFYLPPQHLSFNIKPLIASSKNILVMKMISSQYAKLASLQLPIDHSFRIDDRNLLGMVMLNILTGNVSILLCTADKDLDCDILYLTSLPVNPSYKFSIKSMNESIYITSNASVTSIPLNTTGSSKSLSFDGIFGEVIYLKGRWFAIKKSSNTIVILKETNQSKLTPELAVTTEGQVFNFYGLEVTDNYVIAKVKMVSQGNRMGLILMYVTNPSFFDSNEPDPRPDELNIYNMNYVIHFLTSSPVNDTEAYKWPKIYEHQKKLMLLNGNDLNMITLPPTDYHPKKRKLLFQKYSQLNKTANFYPNEIVRYGFMLPTNRVRFAVLTQRKVNEGGADAKEVYALHEIEWGDTVIDFSNFSDTELQELGEVNLEVIYSEQADYRLNKYKIQFVYENSKTNSWMLLVSAFALVACFLLCSLLLVKCKKAALPVRTSHGSVKGAETIIGGDFTSINERLHVE